MKSKDGVAAGPYPVALGRYRHPDEDLELSFSVKSVMKNNE
jgi:hypothetical protein